jgi:formylglycine-generating enzyme
VRKVSLNFELSPTYLLSNMKSVQLRRFLCVAGALAACLMSPFVSAQQAAARVQMGDYNIDETEVSIGRFAEYAERKGIVTEAERSGGGFEYVMGWQKRQGWNWRAPFGKPGALDEPAVHIKWAEAQAFCQDAGGRLPNKAEWTRAAYTEQRANPPAPYVRGKNLPLPNRRFTGGRKHPRSGRRLGAPRTGW